MPSRSNPPRKPSRSSKTTRKVPAKPTTTGTKRPRTMGHDSAGGSRRPRRPKPGSGSANSGY